MGKKTTAVILIIILLASIGTAYGSEHPTIKIGSVKINDQELALESEDGRFFMDSANRTQAPLRSLVEGLGYECQWDEETEIIKIPNGPKGDVILQVGREYISVGGETTKMDTAPMVKDGKTYVPLRAIAEGLDFYVSASGFSTGVGSVHITTEYIPPPPEPEPIPEPEPEPEPTYDVILGQYTTWFSSSPAGRRENIRVATSSLHGKVIQPGEEFSFNTAIGPITKARGYKDATVIQNGQYVTGVGGGVCQVSTTLYNAALESNMTITRRVPHSLKPNYIPLGRDAAIVYNSSDFKFKNPYDEPVMIMVTCNKEQGYVAISIRGSNSTPPNPSINVTQKNGVYTLTRSVNGVVNYTATSTYKN